MNIKKAISLTAFGFLFTLLDFNLTLNGTTVNVTPDFIGWILLFTACGYFGKYAEGKGWMKAVAGILIAASAAVWALGLISPDTEIGIVKTIVNTAEAVFMFVLFGILEEIAHDYHSQREGTIGLLKILNLVLFVALSALALVADKLEIPVLAGIFAVLGIAALVCAVWTCFVLFGLRKDVLQSA